MTKVEIRDRYECDEDTFWAKVFFDSEFNSRFFLKHLKFERWEVTKSEEDDHEIRRVLEVVPTTTDLPAALKKLAGGQLGFREEGTFDRKSKRHRFRIIPTRLGDKLKIEGEIYVEPRGDSACERIVTMSVEAKMFGIGSMVEKRIIADTESSYHASARYANRELA